MRTNCRIIVSLVLVMTLTSACAPSGDQERSATVIEVVNQVDAHSRSKDDWRPAEVDMAIYGGGRVRTGAASSAQLELLEGILRLTAQSVFTIKESATRQGKLETTLLFQEGRLWAHLTTDQPHEFTVETGNAVAAVRDTHFSVRVAAGTTLLSVAAGQVELMAQGQRVVVAAGQQATAEPGQPPSPPEPMDEEEWEQWAAEAEEVRIEGLDLALPTATSEPPTATVTATSVPPTGTATATSVPPTGTATATSVPPTATSAPTPTQPPVPTETSTPTAAPGLPTIISIDFPSEIPADRTPVNGTVRFQDPDGDVNWVTFDVIGAKDFTPFAYNPMESLVEGDARDGTFKFHTWCGIAQDVSMRVTLVDEAGNRSGAVDFGFRCR